MNHTFRHYILKYKYAISITVFAVVIGFIGDNCLIQRFAQQRDIAELKEDINFKINTYKKDELELEKIHNNPEAVKRVAHEKYYMKTEDEDIFVINGD